MLTDTPWNFADALSKVAVLLISYLSPVKEIVHVLLIFIAVDFISGVWASRKRREKIESRRFRKTLTKFLWYTVALILSYIMERTFHLSWSNLSGIVGGFICFIELKSIFENITVITGEPVFMKILNLIRRRGSKAMEDLSEDDPNTDDNGTD